MANFIEKWNKNFKNYMHCKGEFRIIIGEKKCLHTRKNRRSGDGWEGREGINEGVGSSEYHHLAFRIT